jgi:ribosome-binding factor A
VILKESGRRTKRIAQLIRDHVATYLVTEVGDKRLAQVIVSDVRVSNDLSVAWIGIRLLLSQASDIERRQCIKQLQLLAGRLRRSLAPTLGLRRVPELRFAFDDALDAQRRIEELLEEIDSKSSG